MNKKFRVLDGIRDCLSTHSDEHWSKHGENITEDCTRPRFEAVASQKNILCVHWWLCEVNSYSRIPPARFARRTTTYEETRLQLHAPSLGCSENLCVDLGLSLCFVLLRNLGVIFFLFFFVNLSCIIGKRRNSYLWFVADIGHDGRRWNSLELVRIWWIEFVVCNSVIL